MCVHVLVGACRVRLLLNAHSLQYSFDMYIHTGMLLLETASRQQAAARELHRAPDGVAAISKGVCASLLRPACHCLPASSARCEGRSAEMSCRPPTCFKSLNPSHPSLGAHPPFFRNPIHPGPPTHQPDPRSPAPPFTPRACSM